MKIHNKDGSVCKSYVKELWNYVTDTAVDSFNGDYDLHGDDFVIERIKEFDAKVQKITKDGSQQKEL